MRALPALGVAVVAAALTSHSLAQVLHLDAAQKRYADALMVVLRSWESKEIVLTRDDKMAAAFDEHFSRYGSRGHRIEDLLPAEDIKAQFESMPATVRAQLPMTENAYAVLLGGIIDATPELAAEGIEPTPEALLEALRLSLYLTLVSAQQEGSTGEIDSLAIRRGGLRFFSLAWPFCCTAR